MKRVYIIAIIAALAAGMAAYFFADNLEKKADLESAAKSTVLVAATDIPAGTKITDDNVNDYLVKKTVLTADLTPNAVVEFEDIKGKALMQDVYMGEQVNRSRFDEGGSISQGLSLSLGEGEVAYSIAAEAAQGVDGYIKPGDTVDIIKTVEEKGEKKAEGAEEDKVYKAELAFENLEVLRVATLQDHATAETEGDGEVKTYISVTIKTTKAQAIEIYDMEAKTNGNFKITLNSRGEEE